MSFSACWSTYQFDDEWKKIFETKQPILMENKIYIFNKTVYLNRFAFFKEENEFLFHLKVSFSKLNILQLVWIRLMHFIAIVSPYFFHAK